LRISPTRRPTTPFSYHARPGPSPILVGLVLLVAFVLGFLTHEQGWHEVVLRWARDPRATFAVWRVRTTLPLVVLDVRFADYQQLVSLHERSLRLGVHVPVVDESVAATATFGAGARETVAVRLPGGPATWLESDVWSLELRRAGTTDWVRIVPVGEAAESTWQQWAYLEALRREGFATASQAPVRLQLNGRDLGLYVLETPALAELLLAFDPQPAWAALAAGEPLSEDGFRYADVTIIAGATSPDAPEALARLRTAQAGAAPLSELCDAESLGRFLALTALWLGEPAPDWRTLRWAYDPVTQQLAPVGAGLPWAAVAPLPDAFFDDPAVQVAYARALVELSAPAYLSQVRGAWGDSLEAQWLALGAEGTPWPLLEARQQMLRARLAPERAVAAALAREGANFVLRLTNLQPFPVRIAGLDAGGAGVRALDPAWVFPEDRALLVETGDALVLRAAQGALPQPVRVRLPWNLTTAGGDALTLVARLWDVSAPELRIPVTDFEIIP